MKHGSVEWVSKALAWQTFVAAEAGEVTDETLGPHPTPLLQNTPLFELE